jgi:hypothetical protein
MSNRSFWIAGIAAVLVAAAAFALRAPDPAAARGLAQATATLSGQVRSADNVPLAGIRLAAYTQANTTLDRQPVANITTGTDGRYSVSVPAGPIWMSVLTQDIQGESFWGYDREPVNVTAGATLADQDFVIAIRVLPAGPTPAPPTVPAEPPVGMPSSGQPSPLPGAFVLVLVGLIGAGLVLRRRAAAR